MRLLGAADGFSGGLELSFHAFHNGARPSKVTRIYLHEFLTIIYTGLFDRGPQRDSKSYA